jgi:hypothetical protein
LALTCDLSRYEFFGGASKLLIRREADRLVALLYPDLGMLGPVIHYYFNHYATAAAFGIGGAVNSVRLD